MVTTAVVVISGRTARRPGTPRANGSGSIEDRPPALAPVANRPLLLHVLDSLEGVGIEQVIVAAESHLAPRVEETVALAKACAGRISHIPIGHLTIEAAISAAHRMLGPQPLLVHLADSLTSNLDAVMPRSPLGEHDALLLVEEASEPSAASLGRGRLMRFPGLDSLGAGWVPAGLAVFGSGIGTAPRSVQPTGNHDFELVAAAQRLCSRQGHLEMRPAEHWFRLCSEPGGLLAANRFALERVSRDIPHGTMDEASVAQGAVSIHRSATLESSVVRGPAVIGPRAHLIDAYVGPYTAIGEDVVVDGAEVEHSILLPGSHIRYVGVRLEDSVMGPNARVFRQFRLPNALRLCVGAGAEVSVQ